MQPLILKNTLSCNTLEKPRSTLQKIGIPLRDLPTCVLKQGKEDKDLLLRVCVSVCGVDLNK